MGQRIIRRLIMIGAGAVLILSCASNPEVIRRAPEWVSSPPEDTPDKVYFIGVGTDDGGNVAVAEEKAAGSLISEVSKYIGVKITAETSVEARDTMDAYEAEIREKITESSFAQVSDFKVSDKWIDSRDQQVVVYLLGEYDRVSLEMEQARIRALFREKEEAIAGPEREGDALLESGSPFKAAVKYIQAAVAASSSDVDNAPVRFERTIGKAKEAVEMVTLVTFTEKVTAEAGGEVTEPFQVKVISASGSSASGLPGVSLLVSYREAQSGGRVRVKTEQIVTDEEGIASFTHPVPGFVGEETVTMTLDLRSHMEPLESVSREYRDMVEGLENAVAAKRKDFLLVSVSRAREIRTAVITVDVDRAGNARAQTDSTDGIMEALTLAGFSVIPLQEGEGVTIQNTGDGDIIDRLWLALDGEVKRAVFGVFRISDFEEADGNFLVKVSGTVKAADLETGDIIFTDTRSKRSRGSNSVSAISAAFKGLGKEFGEALASGLP